MLTKIRPRIFFLLAAATVPLSACDESEEHPPIIQSRLTLEAFDDCAALETYVEDSAVRIMRNQITSDYWIWAYAEDRAPEAGQATGAPSGAPTAYTKTNVQVAGVDEADFVKTNGTHVFVLSGESLYVAKSWPAADLALLAKVPIEGYARDMYLQEEPPRVVVLSSVNLPDAQHSASVDCLAYRSCDVWAPGTKVTVLDVSVPSDPVLVGEVYLPGWHQSSRRIGDALRVVLADGFRWPDGLKWWPDYDPVLYADPDALRAARERLADENEPIIRARTLADWLPPASRRLSDGTVVDLGYDCHDFHRTNASIWLGFTTVATVDLAHLAESPGRTSIIAYTDQVYSSTSTMYLAMRHWWWWPEPGTEDWTYLFAFDVTHPDRVDYLGGGGVSGYVLDQWSMDEQDGWLRVATTTTRRVVDEQNPQNRWGRIETSNQVSVLGLSGADLEVVGQSPPLAVGERIQSARFVGDRGFVVTFLQTDPLFTLDLSDPHHPALVGELEVPGFSSYIHPLDDTHLLTIGTYLPEPDEQGHVDWSQRQLKLSIFDVEDFAHPREAFTALVGTAYGWSEASWDHKAFNYFPERGLLAIPFSDFVPGDTGEEYWTHFTSDLRVFAVSAAEGITPKGALTMSDVYREERYGEWTWRWSPWIRRSVMADDWVYAISDAGIRAANVESLGAPVATLLFESPGPSP